MKSLIIISVVALLSGFGTFVYINHSINQMVHDNAPSSAYGVQSGLMVGNAPATGRLLVAVNHKMQPFGQPAEDDTTATMVAQDTHSPMVTVNGMLIQGSISRMQGTSPLLQVGRTQSN